MSEGPRRSDGARRSSEGLLIGALAVAAYAGFAAVMMLDDSGRAPNAAHAGVPVDAVRAATAATATAARTDAPARAAPGVGVGRVIPDPSTRAADPTSRSTVGVQTRSLGASTVDVARTTDAVVGAQGDDGDVRLQFLVKFERDQAMAWRDRYLANPGETRAEWARFASANSAFAGLKLERMSYSGEATLEFEGSAPASPAAARALSDDIVRRLNAADGVEYAEPNLVGVREDVR
jgi:hypothetical protein